MNGKAYGVAGESAGGIDCTFEPDTEDSIEGLVGFGHNQGSEERSCLLERLLKSRRWNFLSGGVHPFDAIRGEFPVERLPRLLAHRDAVPDKRSPQMLLNPARRSLALARRTQGIAHLEAPNPCALPSTARWHLLPSPRPSATPSCVSRQSGRSSDDRQNTGEDSPGVSPPSLRPTMRPGPFAFPEIGIEEIPAMLVNRGEQLPFGRCLRGPEMRGRLVLHHISPTSLIRTSRSCALRNAHS